MLCPFCHCFAKSISWMGPDPIREGRVIVYEWWVIIALEIPKQEYRGSLVSAKDSYLKVRDLP